MSLTEFEPAIPASEQPQAYALDRAATRISLLARHLRNRKGSDFLESINFTSVTILMLL